MRPTSRQQSRSSLSHQFHTEENKQLHQTEVEDHKLDTPSDAQLVLLCLDYLRTLRRTRSTSKHDLEVEEGLQQDYITLAIWALSKAFVRPPELLHGNLQDVEKCLENPLEFGNDPFFQPEYSHFANVDNAVKQESFQISRNLSIPTLALMESEILYKENPKKSHDGFSANDEYSSDFGVSQALISAETSCNPHRISWYEYEDEHYSNQFRFYETMGLSSKLPLTLHQIAISGISALRAQSRLQAEENMMSDQLFTNFVDAVSKNGFFNITEKEILNHTNGKVGMSEDEIIEVSDKIHEERFRKVTAKFRTKLAMKYEEGHELELGRQNDESVRTGPDRVARSLTSDFISTQKKESYKNNEDEKLRENGESFQRQSKYDENNNVKDQGDEVGQLKNKVVDNGQDDDATLVAASVFGDIVADENKYVTMIDDESSKMSKSKVVIDKKDFETAERLKGYGNSAMQKKKYEKAKNYYTKALELLPSGPTSHVYFSNRAAALLSMRNFNEALWDAERSLALKPDYAKAHARLGLAHFLLENYRDAVDSYTLAVEYDPSNKTSQSYLEKSKKKLSATETSKQNQVVNQISTQQVANNMKKQDSDDDPVNERGREVYRASPVSMNRCREPSGTAIVSGDPPGVSKTERSVSPIKRSVSIRSRLERAREYSPHKSRQMMDEELVSTNDPPEFSVSSEPSTKYSDDQVEADRLKGLGNKAMAKKEYEKAVKYYSKSLRLAPAGTNSHVYFSNRAAALCYLERYEEAELDAERSLALNPEYGKAHARLGLSRYFLKDYYGAVEAYESALVHDPHNAASKSYLAKAKSKIGRRQPVRKSYYVE